MKFLSCDKTTEQFNSNTTHVCFNTMYFKIYKLYFIYFLIHYKNKKWKDKKELHK